MSTHRERPTDSRVLDELANVFDDENAAHDLLERIRFPRGRIPRFGEPAAFWRTIAQRLEAGILPDGGGLWPLVGAATKLYWGNLVFRNWLGPDPPPECRPGNCGATILLSTWVEVHEVLDLARELARRRRLSGPLELLYASGEHVALYLCGSDAEEALQLSDALAERLNGRLRRRPMVVADPIRDYLIHRLFVEDPDSAWSELNGVAASAPVPGHAGGMIDPYDKTTWPHDQQGNADPSVISPVQPNGSSHGLKPDKTLPQQAIGDDGPSWAAPLNGVRSVKVLFLAANPLESDRLRVDAEARLLKQIGRDSWNMARRVDVELCLAVQTEDLIAAIEEACPTIVHFAGHGESGVGLILDDGRGGNQTITYEALGELFQQLITDHLKVRCLVLNGCYSAEACSTIGDVVDVIIGSSKEIADDSSLDFDRGFYTSIAEGKSIGAAVRRGKLKMKLHEPPLHSRGNKPEVFSPEGIVVSVRDGANPEQIYL